MLAANEMLRAKMLVGNEISDVEGDSRLKPVKPKTRKLSKSKKLSKSGNLLEFATREVGSSFLTSKTRTIFYRL